MTKVYKIGVTDRETISFCMDETGIVQLALSPRHGRKLYICMERIFLAVVAMVLASPDRSLVLWN
jgi:hypothetical protein